MREQERRDMVAPAFTSFVHFTSFMVLSLLLCCGCNAERTADNAFPQKPIKVIVPFGAGGGSDTFTRIIQKAIADNELIDQPLVVINMPGAGGSIGSRKAKSARPDGYTVLQIHEGMLTNKYSGNANFGPESFTPIAGTGQMAHVIAVADDSPYQDLSDLIDEASEQPDSIVFAVGIGAPSHFAGMMLENGSPNSSAKFRFTQSGGGAKRFASLLGGHSSVSTFSVAEFVEFRASGLRALAILSKERHEKVPDVPTAIEQNVNVSSTNMHFWWAPKGTPPDRVEYLSGVLQKAMELQEVKRVLSDLATDPVVLRGDELATELGVREREISSVSQRRDTDVPDFGLATLVVSLLLGIAVLASSRSGGERKTAASDLDASGQKTSNQRTPQSIDLRSQAVVVALIVSYVVVLQFLNLDYRIATAVFVMLVGGYLLRGRQRLWPVVGLMAIVLGLGLHFLFTQVLVVDLP